MLMKCFSFYSQAMQVKLELGHRASLRTKKTPEGYTHDWSVFVRGPEGTNIEHFIERVIFHLHESFPRAKRGSILLLDLPLCFFYYETFCQPI